MSARATARRGWSTRFCAKRVDARSLFRDVRPRLPSERAGHLCAPGGGGRRARGAPPRLGTAPQLVGRTAPAAEARRGRAQPRKQRRRGGAMRSSSAIRAISTSLPPSAPRAGGLSCSTRSCRSSTRWSATAAASVAACRLPASCASSTAGPFRSADSSSPTRRLMPVSSARSSGLPTTASRSVWSAPRIGSSVPGWQPETPFHVLFVGKLIPLHGLETILAAARLVPEIPFRVVGSGQLERLLDSRPANVDVGALGGLRGPAGRAAAGRCALWASSAPATRRPA